MHLHVFRSAKGRLQGKNSKGEIYLQRRPEWKDIQPGKWDTAVGGHVDYGETPEDALRREVREDVRGKDVLTPNFESEFNRCLGKDLGSMK